MESYTLVKRNTCSYKYPHGRTPQKQCVERASLEEYAVWFCVCEVQKQRWGNPEEKQTSLMVAVWERTGARFRPVEGFSGSGTALFPRQVGGYVGILFIISITHVWFYQFIYDLKRQVVRVYVYILLCFWDISPTFLSQKIVIGRWESEAVKRRIIVITRGRNEISPGF